MHDIGRTRFFHVQQLVNEKNPNTMQRISDLTSEHNLHVAGCWTIALYNQANHFGNGDLAIFLPQPSSQHSSIHLLFGDGLDISIDLP